MMNSDERRGAVGSRRPVGCTPVSVCVHLKTFEGEKYTEKRNRTRIKARCFGETSFESQPATTSVVVDAMSERAALSSCALLSRHASSTMSAQPTAVAKARWASCVASSDA